MLHVVLSLLPICGFAVWQYGLSALALLLAVTATCLLTERLLNRAAAQASTLGDWSAAITGLLLALTLPPSFPLWMGVVAGFVAIAIGKALFGGLGNNVFNPALIGRAFVQAAFPVAITTWVPAFSLHRFSEFVPTTFTAPLMMPPDVAAWIKQQSVDAFTGATPLARWKFENVVASAHDLLTGAVTASTGETSAILILVCGAYLAARKFMDWRIPVAVLASAAFTAWMFQLYDAAHYPSPMFVLLSGGLMIGAVYMATDMATSPVTPLGVVCTGVGSLMSSVLARAYQKLSAAYSDR